MKYSELVEIYEALEGTTKKLKKAEILANFLRKVKKEELEIVINLIQGSVFPQWDARKIGFSSRLILKAISSATGEDSKDVEKMWAKKGDLGLVVEDLISTGGSCLKAVHALEESGCEIAGVVAIFSYGFDQAKEAFAAAKCQYATLTNYDELLKEAIKSNYINKNDMETLENWRTAPQKWLV